MQSNIKSSLSTFSQFWMIFFPISSYFFYSYVGIDPSIEKAMYFVALPVTILLSFHGLYKSQSKKYAKFLLPIFGIMLLSMVNSSIFHGQSFLLSYKVTAKYMAIIYLFYLLTIKPNVKQIERLILILCITYIVLWLYGLYKVPQVVFGQDLDEVIDDSRGIFRLRMAGSTIVVLAFFMSINKYIISKKKSMVSFFFFFVRSNYTSRNSPGYCFFICNWDFLSLV